MTEDQYATITSNVRLNLAIDLLREVLNDLSKPQLEAIQPIELIEKHIQPLEHVSRAWWRLGIEAIEDDEA